jgi:hypothetical protein
VLYRILDALPEALGSPWIMKRAAKIGASDIEERPRDCATWLIDGPDELSLEIRYQQWFHRVRNPPDTRQFASISGLNIPDYILVMRRRKQPISWLILDAKYRSGQQAIDQGLGDIHRYRDALRVSGLVAAGAYIFVPCLQRREAPYGRSDYHAAQNFGVLQLYSEDWLQPIERWIASVLECASPKT